MKIRGKKSFNFFLKRSEAQSIDFRTNHAPAPHGPAPQCPAPHGPAAHGPAPHAPCDKSIAAGTYPASPYTAKANMTTKVMNYETKKKIFWETKKSTLSKKN